MHSKLASLAVVLALSIPALAATEHQGVPLSGTLGAPILVGPNIEIFGVQLLDGRMMDISCPIYRYHHWETGSLWMCSDGTLSVNGVVEVTGIQGVMYMHCHNTTCRYVMGAYSDRGPIQMTAQGSPYVGTVTFLDGVW